MDEDAEKRKVYCAAILAANRNDKGEPCFVWQAQAFLAWSHNDARMKASVWAKEKYPTSEGYYDFWIQTLELAEATPINNFMAELGSVDISA